MICRCARGIYDFNHVLPSTRNLRQMALPNQSSRRHPFFSLWPGSFYYRSLLYTLNIKDNLKTKRKLPHNEAQRIFSRFSNTPPSLVSRFPLHGSSQITCTGHFVNVYGEPMRLGQVQKKDVSRPRPLHFLAPHLFFYYFL